MKIGQANQQVVT